MKKHLIYSMLFVGLICLIPSMMEATSTDTLPFGGKDINKHADNISEVLFGPIARIAAMFGGITGIVVGLIQHSFTKILTFGGILLVSAALPKFIQGFYSMLLP